MTRLWVKQSIWLLASILTLLTAIIILIACAETKSQADPVIPDKNYGKYLIARKGCYGCHNIKGFKNTDPVAVSLKGLGSKVRYGWIEKWLKDPKAYAAHSKMPRFVMNKHEIEKIAHALYSLKNPSLKASPSRRGRYKEGERLFTKAQCMRCHTRKGKGGTVGPELTHLSRKVNRDWLYSFLKNPQSFYPNTKMPQYRFSETELLDLAEYLLEEKLNGKEPQTVINKKDAREGFQFIKSWGCVGCHNVPKSKSHKVAPNLYNLHRRNPDSIYPDGTNEKNRSPEIAIQLKLKRSHIKSYQRMPQFDLTDTEIQHITYYLMGLKDDNNEVESSVQNNLPDNTPIDSLEDYWTIPVAPQKAPPKSYSLQESSLDPASCGICHKQQYKDWRSTLHSKSMGPGVIGQLVDTVKKNPGFVDSCQECHSPLSEQYILKADEDGNYQKNPVYDKSLSHTGLNCAACHVRAHRRYSSPKKGREVSQPSFMPKKYHIHGGVIRKKWFKESRFCARCHQFKENGRSVNGKLIENTYKEWKASPWAEKGVNCQDCHMPKRRHLWRGIHDPDMVRSGVKLKVTVDSFSGNKVKASIQLINQRVGHHFPTYVTPAVFIYAKLLDEKGNTIPETLQKDTIQRVLNGQLTKELSDTRIPSGESRTLKYLQAHKGNAAILEVRVEVHPDYFYLGFFKDRLKSNESSEAKKYYQTAKNRNQNSPYVLYQVKIPLAGDHD